MANRASSVSTRRSQARASWKPAPMAWPRTAAMLIRSGRRSQAKACWKVAMTSAASAGSRRASCGMRSPWPPRRLWLSGVSLTALRSRPDEKARPSPRTIATRMSPDRSRPICRSSSHMAGVCALRTWGRHNVTVATGPSRSRRTPESVTAAPSPQHLGALPTHLLLCHCDFLRRRAPPRWRSCTPDSVRTRCTNPYERPVDEARARMLSPLVYLLTRSFASVGSFGSDDPAALLRAGGCAGGCHLESLTSYSGRIWWNTASCEVMFPVSPIRPSSSIMRQTSIQRQRTRVAVSASRYR